MSERPEVGYIRNNHWFLDEKSTRKKVFAIYIIHEIWMPIQCNDSEASKTVVSRCKQSIENCVCPAHKCSREKMYLLILAIHKANNRSNSLSKWIFSIRSRTIHPNTVFIVFSLCWFQTYDIIWWINNKFLLFSYQIWYGAWRVGGDGADKIATSSKKKMPVYIFIKRAKRHAHKPSHSHRHRHNRFIYTTI